MITEDEFMRRRNIRDIIKATHNRISRTQEKEQREDLGECLNETLTAMDELFTDENLWRTILGEPDQAEDFVEETIGLSSFMNYTNKHGAEAGGQDPMYHRQMRIPLIRRYAIMELGLREILSHLHMITEDEFTRRRDIRDIIKATHNRISRTQEKEQREDLGECLNETLTAMDELFTDENLGEPDQAEDFVEETIGLSSFMNYTNKHGAEAGGQDPMYHRQMRIPLIRRYAIMELGLREILSLKGLLDRITDKKSTHVSQHPLIMRTKEDRVCAQLGTHYMKTIGQDLVMNSDMPHEFLKPLQDHS